MKKIYYLLILGCFMLIVSSCSTSTKFTVYGEPGTEILTPSKKTLATINNSGNVEITNPDDDYYAFLLSHTPGTTDYIPFALDYEEKSYHGAKIARATFVTLFGVGIIAAAVGLISVAGNEDSESGPALAGGGLGLATVSACSGLAASCRASQTNHEYHYKYLSTQKTNQDIALTQPVLSTASTNVATVSKKNPVSKDTLSQVSTRIIKDYGKLTEGTYKGSGTLKQKTSTIESYDNISVVITRVNKNEADVNVIESGSEFFPKAIRYTITKKRDGSYVLTAKNLSSATISIDKNGNLKFYHPKVNIEGEIYILSINAKRHQ